MFAVDGSHVHVLGPLGRAALRFLHFVKIVLVHVARRGGIALHAVRGFGTRHARIIQASEQPCQLEDLRGQLVDLDSSRGETATCPKYESRFPIAFPNSAQSPHPLGLTSAANISPRLMKSPDTKDQQHTDGVSFARISSRFKPEQQPSQGTHSARCTTLAQRVQLPLQWKGARNFADAALRLSPRLTGVPRCFSSRHSWAVADW